MNFIKLLEMNKNVTVQLVTLFKCPRSAILAKIASLQKNQICDSRKEFRINGLVCVQIWIYSQLSGCFHSVWCISHAINLVICLYLAWKIEIVKTFLIAGSSFNCPGLSLVLHNVKLTVPLNLPNSWTQHEIFGSIYPAPLHEGAILSYLFNRNLVHL